MGLCPALLRCLTLWATSVSPVWVCVRRCSAVLPCHLSITSMGLCPALLRCPTLPPQYHKYGSVSGVAPMSYPATSVSQVWICVRRCSAVLPCHLSITSMGLCPALLRCPTLPPQYHKYGSVSGVAPLSYPATSVSQVWVCVRRCSAVLPCHLSITSMGLCPALLRCPTLPPQYHKYGSVSGVAPLSYPATSVSQVWVCVRRCSAVLPCHLSITSMDLCPALFRCPTLWVTSVSSVRVCVRRCSAVLPCGSPQYHKYGSVYGVAPQTPSTGLRHPSFSHCPI